MYTCSKCNTKWNQNKNGKLITEYYVGRDMEFCRYEQIQDKDDCPNCNSDNWAWCTSEKDLVSKLFNKSILNPFFTNIVEMEIKEKQIHQSNRIYHELDFKATNWYICAFERSFKKPYYTLAVYLMDDKHQIFGIPYLDDESEYYSREDVIQACDTVLDEIRQQIINVLY